jgi:transposase
VVRCAHNKTDPLSLWIQRLVQRRGIHKATVALANKLVRIAWAMVVYEQDYRPATQHRVATL